MRRALAIYEKALGPEHPATGTILNNLVALGVGIGVDYGINVYLRYRLEGPGRLASGRSW